MITAKTKKNLDKCRGVPLVCLRSSWEAISELVRPHAPGCGKQASAAAAMLGWLNPRGSSLQVLTGPRAVRRQREMSLLGQCSLTPEPLAGGGGASQEGFGEARIRAA